jgi:hypothetical protein
LKFLKSSGIMIQDWVSSDKQCWFIKTFRSKLLLHIFLWSPLIRSARADVPFPGGDACDVLTMQAQGDIGTKMQ